MSEKLQDFVDQITNGSHLRVEHDFGGGFVRLQAAEAERRQAKHDIRSCEDAVIEMLRNSRDAHAKNIFLAAWREGEYRKVTVIDDGDGIPESMQKQIFEARVTSKLDSMHMDIWGVHGRGMALYAIKENTESAHVACSKINGGSAINVVADTRKLPEKKDQSTLPVFVFGQDGAVTVRGPKNIARTVSEFAYVERSKVRVYFGSVAEIAASLYALSNCTKTHTESQDIELDVCQRLSLAENPDEFEMIAATLGLPMSARTARRIMNGEIKAIQALSNFHTTKKIDAQAQDWVESQGGKAASKTSATQAIDDFELAKPKLSQNDRDEFCRAILQAFSNLADSYYLDMDIEPKLKVSKGKLEISIPLRTK